MSRVLVAVKRLADRLVPAPVSEQHRSIREIKDAIGILEAEFSMSLGVLEDELKEARLRKQDLCHHPSDKIHTRKRSFMEERRSQPIEWEERYCAHCGKVLAESQNVLKKVWVEKL